MHMFENKMEDTFISIFVSMLITKWHFFLFNIKHLYHHFLIHKWVEPNVNDALFSLPSIVVHHYELLLIIVVDWFFFQYWFFSCKYFNMLSFLIFINFETSYQCLLQLVRSFKNIVQHEFIKVFFVGTFLLDDTSYAKINKNVLSSKV
jgi:hypothetical protein